MDYPAGRRFRVNRFWICPTHTLREWTLTTDALFGLKELGVSASVSLAINLPVSPSPVLPLLLVSLSFYSKSTRQLLKLKLNDI